jgi:hypothetical protein
MQFTYTYLKNAAENDIKLGTWEGNEVYAISKYDVLDAPRWFAYVLYDDDNLLYHDGRIHGQVSAGGAVSTCKPRAYSAPRREEAPQETHPTTPTTTNEETGPTVVGDVQLEIMVDNTLKAAREMSIDSLLEGFNYGL